MLNSNQQMDFANGYQAAMEEVYRLLTENDGRTEAYESTLAWVKDAVGK